MDVKNKNYFAELRKIPTRKHFQKKGNLDYLPWAIAWDLLKKSDPKAEHITLKPKDENGNELERQYFTDGRTCHVECIVTAFDQPIFESLPIMDNRNNSIPLEKITSRIVYDSIQRCKVKAIALHGIGLNAWTNEMDPLPELSDDQFEHVMKGTKKQAETVFTRFVIKPEHKEQIKNKFKI